MRLRFHLVNPPGLCALLGAVCMGLACAPLASHPGPAPASLEAERPDAELLLGRWQVDLRPTADSPAYYKEFVVLSIEGTSFEGVFYDTMIEDGRLNADWDELHFAFVTRDGAGAYNHSGVLRDGHLAGLSHSLARDFLSVWSATPLD